MIGQAKIAIIEDDPTISQMYRMKFESEGFDVSLASNGRAGVELVADKRPDMILLDLQMPEMNGVDALKQIRKLPHGADTPVIVLTNLGGQEAPKEIHSLGISDYIIKADMTPRQVVDLVKQTLGVTPSKSPKS
jgi:DNA-binding response OmpR family regulator